MLAVARSRGRYVYKLCVVQWCERREMRLRLFDTPLNTCPLTTSNVHVTNILLQFWKSGAAADGAGADAGVVPEEWLEADIKQGITNQHVEDRRKRYGWNEITTEKENLFIKFLMFFTGPILYGTSNHLLHHHLLSTQVTGHATHCICAMDGVWPAAA